MPRLIASLFAIAILFCLLCGPVTWIALRLWRRGDLGAFRPLRAVWMVQVALACALVFALDSMGFDAGLRNPIGSVVAIVLAVSAGGAVLYGLWRLLAHRPAR